MKSKRRWLFAALIVVGFITAWAVPWSGEYRPEFYQPTKAELDLLRGIPHKARIADWNFLGENEPLEITSIELHGSWNYLSRQKYDLTTKKQKHIELIQEALKLRNLKRFPLSDVAIREPKKELPAPLFGGIVIHTPQKNLIIAATYDRYQLGTTSLNSENGFQSWFLTKAVDDILADEKGVHLEEEIFESLSGLEGARLEKEAYEKIMSEE